MTSRYLQVEQRDADLALQGVSIKTYWLVTSGEWQPAADKRADFYTKLFFGSFGSIKIGVLYPLWGNPITDY